MRAEAQPVSSGAGEVSSVTPTNTQTLVVGLGDGSTHAQLTYLGRDAVVEVPFDTLLYPNATNPSSTTTCIMPTFAHPQLPVEFTSPPTDLSAMGQVASGKHPVISPGVPGADKLYATPVSQLTTEDLGELIMASTGRIPSAITFEDLLAVQASGAVSFHVDPEDPVKEATLVGFPATKGPAVVAIALLQNDEQRTQALRVVPLAQASSTETAPLPDTAGVVRYLGTLVIAAAPPSPDTDKENSTMLVCGPDVHLLGDQRTVAQQHGMFVLTGLTPEAAAAYGTPLFTQKYEHPPVDLERIDPSLVDPVREWLNLPTLSIATAKTLPNRESHTESMPPGRLPGDTPAGTPNGGVATKNEPADRLTELLLGDDYAKQEAPCLTVQPGRRGNRHV